MAFYLGQRPQGDWIVFQSIPTPTRASTGNRFQRAVGPFESKVGAMWFNRYGRNHPEARSADAVEQLARQDARMQQAIIEETMSLDELREAWASEWYERFVDEYQYAQALFEMPDCLERVNAYA